MTPPAALGAQNTPARLSPLLASLFDCHGVLRADILLRSYGKVVGCGLSGWNILVDDIGHR